MNEIENQRWTYRIILTVSTPEGAELTQKQMELIESAKDGIQERHLVVYSVPYQDVDEALVKRLKLESNVPFQVLLIGKDGGVKLRSNDIVTIDRFFTLIDSMPMRRQEMTKMGEHEVLVFSQASKLNARPLFLSFMRKMNDDF